MSDMSLLDRRSIVRDVKELLDELQASLNDTIETAVVEALEDKLEDFAEEMVDTFKDMMEEWFEEYNSPQIHQQVRQEVERFELQNKKYMNQLKSLMDEKIKNYHTKVGRDSNSNWVVVPEKKSDEPTDKIVQKYIQEINKQR